MYSVASLCIIRLAHRDVIDLYVSNKLIKYLPDNPEKFYVFGKSHTQLLSMSFR